MARGKNISQETLNWVAKRDADRKEKFNQSFTFGKTPQEWEKETGNKLLSYQTSNGKLMGGNMAYQSPEQQKQGQIGQSFGRMIGGGGGMGGFEAASMRLADAAAARDIAKLREEERIGVRKFEMEREAQSRDQERAELKSKISQYESQLDQVRSAPVRSNTEQTLKNKKIADLESSISSAKSELRNLSIREEYSALNRASSLM
jgi:hypothetical protein